MIDFRYHLVSLISVFLALAVGIVLGAGPLREGIGESLTGQVEALRADRDQLRADLEAQIIDTNDRDAWIAAMGEQASAGLLAGRTVGVIALPGADDADVAAVVDVLGAADAQISVVGRLTAAWVEADQTYRQTFAQQLAGYLDPAPADASPETVMALAVAQLLRDWAGADNPNPAVLLELLRGGDQPFLTLESDPTSAVGSVVVVGPRPAVQEPQPTATATAAPVVLDAAGMVSAIAGTLPTVTIGDADVLILAIREAGVPTSTIDSVGEIPATTSVPFALAAELAGTHGRYGSAASANAPVPPLVDLLSPIEPTAEATAG